MRNAPRCWHSRGDDQTYQRNEGDPMEITLDPPHPDEVSDRTAQRVLLTLDVDVPVSVHHISAFRHRTTGPDAGQVQVTFGDAQIGQVTLNFCGTADAIRAIGAVWDDIAIEIERQCADARSGEAA